MRHACHQLVCISPVCVDRYGNGVYWLLQIVGVELHKSVVDTKPPGSTFRTFYINVQSAAAREIREKLQEEFLQERHTVFGQRGGGISLLKN